MEPDDRGQARLLAGTRMSWGERYRRWRQVEAGLRSACEEAPDPIPEAEAPGPVDLLDHLDELSWPQVRQGLRVWLDRAVERWAEGIKDALLNWGPLDHPGR